jgi:uncharacterized protein with HEPN domain
MSKRSHSLLIEDIIDSGEKILVYTKGLTFDQFIQDSKTIDSVVRNFENIGEAANRLPDSFKDKFPAIDWHRIRGFRNRIVHDYFGIDFAIVWQIKDSYLPEMISKLQSISQ